MNPIGFNERARPAIADETLQRALAKILNTFRVARDRALSEVDEAGLRQRARDIRDEALTHLDQYLPQLADNATRNGMIVHWAGDAAKANRTVIEIARSHGIKRVVKAKSMLTEEIGLNHALGEAGLSVVETDLGEWIIQLAGQRPAHILGPALNMSRTQIAEIFTRHFGRQVPDDITAMTALARRELRDKFLAAEMGISGANFVVAESGTVAILTNEGNARFVTGLPHVHVAVVGIEKVVPSWDDLAVLLTLLPRSATGQRITTYVNLINGPRRAEEADGPDEVHLVLVDNGRSQLLGTPYQPVLRCIRCSACLNVCPVYEKVGGHVYNTAYVGPIGAVLTPALHGLAQHHELSHASSLCFACRDACPVMIDLPGLLLELRREAAEGRSTQVSRMERWGFALFGWGSRHPRLFELALQIGKYVQRPFVRQGRIASAPFPLSHWTQLRDFPALDSQPFRERWKSL